jgi:glyoxylase I family protein
MGPLKLPDLHAAHRAPERRICDDLPLGLHRDHEGATYAAGVSERPRQIGVSHLGISVTDLARSEAFYCDVLGARVLYRQHESEWGRRTVVTLGPHAIDLNQFARNDGGPFDPAKTGLDHLAFTASSREQLEDWADWLDAQGVSRSPIRDVRNDPLQDPDAQAVGVMFDFADPDGIQLEFLFFDIAKRPPSP